MEGFTKEQLDQLRNVFREELADAGLRLDSVEHQDEAREDFRFVRRLRKGVDSTAAKIGWTIILATLGGIVWLLTAGLNAWKG